MRPDRIPPPSILFAPDSGAEVGGGHVMRCLTLARVLGGRGWRVSFCVAAAGRRLIQTFGWPEIAIKGDVHAPADVVVLDAYGPKRSLGAELRSRGRRVVVIDDLADRDLDCDLVVDASFGRRAEDYAGLAEGARVLAGPAYALLRPGFAAGRAAALARRDGRPVRRVLVALGLTDLGGVTWDVVVRLTSFPAAVLDVVVGSAAPSLPDLERLSETDSRMRLHVNAADMDALMARADIAIGAGGSSTWERACLGLPSITLILAENQRALAHALERAGATLAVEAETAGFEPPLLEACRRLEADAGLRIELARRSAELCDGLGAGRVADAIEALFQTPSSGSPGS